MKGTMLHDYQLLRVAADHIDTVGLLAGDFAPPKYDDPAMCMVCAEGAMRWALTGDPMLEPQQHEDLALLDTTKDSLMDLVNMGFPMGYSLWEWSDELARIDPAGARVIRTMRYAADLMEIEAASRTAA